MPEITHSFLVDKNPDGTIKLTRVEPTEYLEMTDNQRSAVIEFWNGLLDVSVAGCIGCGYCCAKSPCWLALKHDTWKIGSGCAALVWTGDRHVCKFVIDDPEQYAASLAIGAGCSSSMFNEFRKTIRCLVGTHLQ